MVRYLPDTNVWLALAVSGHPHHAPARDWIDGVPDDDEVVICRSVQLSLLRLLTTAAVFVPMGSAPLTNVEAWAVVDEITSDLRVRADVEEPAGVGRAWRAYSSLPSPSPKTWMDAYLAAFARAAGATLVTIDRAFLAYPRLEPILIASSR